MAAAASKASMLRATTAAAITFSLLFSADAVRTPSSAGRSAAVKADVQAHQRLDARPTASEHDSLLELEMDVGLWEDEEREQEGKGKIECSEEAVADMDRLGLMVVADRGWGRKYVSCKKGAMTPTKISCWSYDCGELPWCWVQPECGGYFTKWCRPDASWALTCSQDESDAADEVPDSEKVSKKCEYEQEGFKVGDLVEIKFAGSPMDGTEHYVACPTEGSEGYVCLKQGDHNTGCWPPHVLFKLSSGSIDTFQGMLKKWTGKTRVSLGNFYEAVTKPGAWGKGTFSLSKLAYKLGWKPRANPSNATVEKWSKEKCDADFDDPIGYITVGVTYDHQAMVDEQVAKNVPPRFGRVFGRVVRNNLVSENIGAKISEKVAQQAPEKITEGLQDQVFDVFNDPSKIKIRTEGGRSYLLLEFKICKIDDDVRFFQCHVSKQGKWIGKGSPLDFLANFGWRVISSMPGFGSILNPKVMATVLRQIPPQVYDGLKNQVKGANVCAWPTQIVEEGEDNSDELFGKLKDPTKCPQMGAEQPPSSGLQVRGGPEGEVTTTTRKIYTQKELCSPPEEEEP